MPDALAAGSRDRSARGGGERIGPRIGSQRPRIVAVEADLDPGIDEVELDLLPEKPAALADRNSALGPVEHGEALRGNVVVAGSSFDLHSGGHPDAAVRGLGIAPRQGNGVEAEQNGVITEEAEGSRGAGLGTATDHVVLSSGNDRTREGGANLGQGWSVLECAHNRKQRPPQMQSGLQWARQNPEHCSVPHRTETYRYRISAQATGSAWVGSRVQRVRDARLARR